ncbi:hypothetical protein [Reyranella sp.]|nr:hypothetical protein [Reyranella sp.]
MGRLDQLEQGVGIVTVIGNDTTGFEAGAQVVRLSGGSQEPTR